MLRAMRGAVSMGFFQRDAEGRYSNNRLSSTLRSSEVYDVRSFAEYFGSRSNMEAWCDFPETLRTGKNAFERVHGKSIWDWFDEHPHERQTFADSMMAMTLADAPGIATTYPFAEIQRLCDVGGGRGTLLSEILVRHPHLRATLCDNAGVLDSARELLTTRGVIERVELVPGSFFDAVPRGSDAYVMKHILHDWDDERCIAILKNCRSAMEPGNRLLVVEAIVEDDDRRLRRARRSPHDDRVLRRARARARRLREALRGGGLQARTRARGADAGGDPRGNRGLSRAADQGSASLPAPQTRTHGFFAPPRSSLPESSAASAAAPESSAPMPTSVRRNRAAARISSSETSTI